MSIVSFKFNTEKITAPALLTATNNLSILSVNGSNAILLQTLEGIIINVIDVTDLVNLNAGDIISMDDKGRIINHGQPETKEVPRPNLLSEN